VGTDETRESERAPARPTGSDATRTAWEARRGRFHAEARAHTSVWVRGALVVLGTVFLVTGVVGIFLPVLPTTPFVLAAAACYVRASPALYNAVLSNRVVGPAVYAWRTTRTIPRRVQRVAIAVVAVTFATSIAFAVRPLWARLAMAALGLGLAAWIARLPTTPRAGGGDVGGGGSPPPDAVDSDAADGLVSGSRHRP